MTQDIFESMGVVQEYDSTWDFKVPSKVVKFEYLAEDLEEIPLDLVKKYLIQDHLESMIVVQEDEGTWPCKISLFIEDSSSPLSLTQYFLKKLANIQQDDLMLHT